MTQGQDLLTGSVPKKLIRFAFPLFLANLLQALYNVVDMLVVGKIVGKTGLAAISNASMLCFIINCNGVQREHNKKLNNGLPILHKVPPKRDYGRYFCIMAEKGGTSHGA